MHWTDLSQDILTAIRQGGVIPAVPLALNRAREFDRQRQAALIRYYLDAGSSGIAVGVHTTQFAIRSFGLYEPVLRTAAETADHWQDRPIVRIAGLVGDTRQASREADIARNLGYHAGLLSLTALKGASEEEILDHCRTVAGTLPVIGFYMQAAVGGLALSAAFWRRFSELDNVIAIKIAPFNRYKTLDVVRGVVAAGAEDRITLYTGNDDHIVLDLLTPFRVVGPRGPVTVRIHGGLLGHWSVWTRTAVDILRRCHAAAEDGPIAPELLTLDAQVTDCNSAFFDVANDFAGCIAGCHEVLRRQGLLEGIWCLDREETLGPGQMAEIDRVYRDYRHLADDEFVAANLDRWLTS